MSSQKAKQKLANEKYPAIPSKLYFTIGEASALCLVKPHVLRYWEQEFSQLSPSKRRGNRRYYQHADIILVRNIKDLLYNRGFTIEGARAQLNTSSKPEVKTMDTEIKDADESLESLLSELEEA
jgi:DNA-binding transcriptional MerR regulator